MWGGGVRAVVEFDGAALKFREVLGSRDEEVAEPCAWTVAASSGWNNCLFPKLKAESWERDLKYSRSQQPH